MNKDGSMNANAGARFCCMRGMLVLVADETCKYLLRLAGAYAGMDREVCRKKLWVRQARMLLAHA